MPARWVKPVKTTSAPRVLVTLAYDPLDSREGGNGFETTAASWSMTGYRRREGLWHRLRECDRSGVSGGEVWTTLSGLGSRSSRIYVVAPSAGDCLTLLDFWPRVDDSRLVMRSARPCKSSKPASGPKQRPHPLILGTRAEVVGWSDGPTEFKIVSYCNHLSIPLIDAARHAGYPACPESRVAYRPTGHAFPDSQWTAGALSAVYRRMIDWWVANGCGRWQDTIGAAAYQWWRTTLGHKAILEHDVPAAKAMEDAAVQGGRVQLFWFGSAGRTDPTADRLKETPRAVDLHLKEPVYKIDVRSMYASLLRSRLFPTRLLHRLRFASVKKLRSALSCVGAVATVRVRLEAPRLPFRHPQRGTVYPVGSWWTTLTTPELVTATERDEVADVADVWVYSLGAPFAQFAERVTELRMGAIESGDNLAGTFCKTVANALGGRLARTGRGWAPCDRGPCRRRWGMWAEVDADDGSRQTLRGVAGIRQRHVDRRDRPGGLAACFAHLTAYGRSLLAGYIDTAGEGTVLWCDTDGMIVTATGVDRLRAAGLIRTDEPGFLRVEGEVTCFAARTPKHYCTGDAWVLSGTRDDYGPVDDGVVRCYQSANPVRAAVDPAGKGLLTRARTLRLDSIPLSGTPGRDGWLIPPDVQGGQFRQPQDVLPPELAGWDY